MALDLTQLTELETFLSGYNEAFQKAEIRKSPIDLPAGMYTGRIESCEFDIMKDGSKYMLNTEIIALSTEPRNENYIGSLTKKTEWINPLDTTEVNGVPKWVVDLKQVLFDLGLILDNKQMSELANPQKSLLPTVVGSEIRFEVQHNVSKKNGKTYVNIYIREVLTKPNPNSIKLSRVEVEEKEPIPF